VVAAVPLAGEVANLAAPGDVVWVSLRGQGELLRVLERTEGVAGRLAVGREPRRLVAVDGAVFVFGVPEPGMATRFEI
jgi:predicted NAD/FAD-dependent oxidoreductase